MKSLYPRFFLTPEGNPVSIKQMSFALSQIRANPSADYPGWNWYKTSGYSIIRSFRAGLHERINGRGRMQAGQAVCVSTPNSGDHRRQP